MRRAASGFALLDLIFVCGIIGVLCSIALPRLTLAKSVAGSASAIGSMRAINSAQLTFALTCGGGFYAPDLPTLGIAPTGSREPFLGPGLTEGVTVSKSGYNVKVAAVAYAPSPASCNGLAAGGAGRGFIASADSTDPQNPRYFAINASGQIYEHSSSLFAVMPEVGAPPVGHPLLR